MSTRFRAAGERCSSRFPAASFSEFGGILFYRGADKKLHSILKKNMKTGDLNLLKRFSLTFEKIFGFGCFICIIAPSLVSKANCFSRNNAQRRVGSQNWNQKWSQFWEPTSCYFAASFAPLAAPLLLPICCSSDSPSAPLHLQLLLVLLFCCSSAAPLAAPFAAPLAAPVLPLCTCCCSSVPLPCYTQNSVSGGFLYAAPPAPAPHAAPATPSWTSLHKYP